MSKFVLVRKVPESLRKGEVAFKAPNFMDQIEANASRMPRSGLTAVHHLRDVLNSVQQKYETDLDIFKLPLSQYEGVKISSNEEMSRFLVRLLRQERPEIFEKVLEYNIKNRPYGTKLIYFTGEHQDSGPFFRNGISSIEEDEIDEYLGLKPKKVVGKPAVTKDFVSAENNKEDN